MEKQPQRTFSHGASKELHERAKQLRRNMTESEQILWQLLRDKSKCPYKVRRQHPVSKFILDFYIHQVKLGIEIDGAIHLSKVAQLYDEDRTRILQEFGITIIRFVNGQVINKAEEVLSKIKLKVEELS